MDPGVPSTLKGFKNSIGCTAMRITDNLRKLIIPVGIGVGCLVLLHSVWFETALTYYKLTGKTACSWKRMFTAGRDGLLIRRFWSDNRASILPDGTDPKFGIDHFRTPSRSFWIKSRGADMD